MMICFQKNKKDALNFDAEFTKEEPVLTPVSADVLRCINQVCYHILESTP